MVFRRLLATSRAARRCRRLHAAGNDPSQTAAGQSPVPASRPCRASSSATSGRPIPTRRCRPMSIASARRLVSQSGVSGNYPLRRARPAAGQCACRAGGYVFVTRGLLALLDDEAELAAALGHEVGHLVQRHAAQRARGSARACSTPPSRPPTSTGSITVGRSVARDGLLALRRYSREQELEADRIGVGHAGQGRLSRRRHGRA